MYKKITTIKVLKCLLNEVYDEEKHPGWDRSTKNRQALSMKKTRQPEAETQVRDEFKKKGITANIDFDNYYFYEQFNKFWETLMDPGKGTFIGKSGKELGISKLDDPYMYQKVGANKYRVVAGPKASAIGKEFEASQKKEESGKDKESSKANKKPSENFTYTIGNTATVDGVKGVKFLKRKEGDKKIIKTFLIPDNLDAENIMSRVAPNPFKKEEDQNDLSDAGYAYEKETGKEIKGLEPVLPEKGKKMPPSSFFGTFGPIVKRAARGTDVFPSVTLAQAAIETGWGRSTVGNAKNMFGIKAKGKTSKYWSGESVKKNTTEYIDGKKGTYNLGFRKYNSLTDSILDHNEFLKVNQRYSKALQATTPEKQAQLIHKAGYATDPNYSDKIISMIKKYDLKQYDDDILAAKGVKSSEKRIAENKKRKNKMIIIESQLRSTIRKILLEATEKFEDFVKDKASGNEFRAWVNKNHADVAKKLDLDPSGSFNNTYIKKAWNELGDEYSKVNKQTSQKKKNLSTGGKFKFLKGSNPDGTYPAGRGMKNSYFKFVKDSVVFALDPSTKTLGQMERGKGGDFISENEKRLFENVLQRKIIENFISARSVFKALKRGDVDDPGEVFSKNKELIQKIAKEKVDSMSKLFSPVLAQFKDSKSKSRFPKANHSAYDWAMPEGSPYISVADGVVMRASRNNNWSNKFAWYGKSTTTYYSGESDSRLPYKLFPGMAQQSMTNHTSAPKGLKAGMSKEQILNLLKKLPLNGKERKAWTSALNGENMSKPPYEAGKGGNSITIKHTDPTSGEEFTTFCGHLKDVYVGAGEKVTGGQLLGTCGSTGRSTGPHFHWQMKGYKGSKSTDKGAYDKFLAQTVHIENPIKAGESGGDDKPALTENQLRRVVRRLLTESTANFEDFIKDKASGNEFRAWVNKNKPAVAKKLDLDPSGSFNNAYIKKAWNELGDEYSKETKASKQKKKNLSTGGEYLFLKGGNPDGTYPAGRGMKNPYLKFVKDNIVFALDPNEADPKKAIGQLERGKGGNFMNESKKRLFETVLQRKIMENFVNPARVLSSLKKGQVKDPDGVFAKNKEKIIKLANSIKLNDYSEFNASSLGSGITKVMVNGQACFGKPGVFRIMTAKCKATVALFFKLSEELGYERPPVITSGPRSAGSQNGVMANKYWRYVNKNGQKISAGRKELVRTYRNDKGANAISDMYDKIYTPGISMDAFRAAALNKTNVTSYLKSNTMSNHQGGNAFDVRTKDGHEDKIRAIIDHSDMQGLIKPYDETDRGDNAHFHISVLKAPPKQQVTESNKSKRRL